MAREGNAEWLAGGALFEEALVVDMAVGPPQCMGTVEGVVDHAVRATNVDMAAQRARAEDAANVQALILALYIEVHTLAIPGLQFQAQGGVRRATYGQVQFEGGLLYMQLFELRVHRSDADTTGNEQVLAGMFSQGEQVGRLQNLQLVTFADFVVQVA
ncbi:hypothetical protein D3C72_1885500 [compost metagenome]